MNLRPNGPFHHHVGVVMTQRDGGFDVDFAHGAEGEMLLWAFLSKCEVKRDRRTRESGNVFVETAIIDKHSGVRKASGIVTTAADWWAFMLDDAEGKPYAVVLVPTHKLRALIMLADREVSGGDDGRARGVLVRVDALPRP